MNKKENPEYPAWRSMKERCLNPNHKRYKDYGGRGIKVCERWIVFDNFLEDMGEKPKAGEGHGSWKPGEEAKRSLRARPPRNTAPVRVPVLDWFAACVYLNWSGWHDTGPEIILREFHKIFKEGL